MLHAEYFRYNLIFKSPGTTSRGTLYEKPSWILRLSDKASGKTAYGECGPIPGLSPELEENYEEILDEIILSINSGDFPEPADFQKYPSIQFGLEMLRIDFETGGNRVLCPSAFTRGEDEIPINGLIWMGDRENMLTQIKHKLEEGFNVLKLKIGGLSFEDELSIIGLIRREYKPENLEIRTDANGSFEPGNALERLKRLSDFYIHSIEQPIKAGQWDEMAGIAAKSPVPVALDEELTGIHDRQFMKKMLATIKPAYIIIKPSLTGGFEKSQEWINIAENEGAGFWITSALESNIGLNALAQWSYTLNGNIIHGLGTGEVYSNNVISPLRLSNGRLRYNPDQSWDFSPLFK